MPLPTTNLYLHLDAGTFSGSDGDPIGTLADQSGNGFDGTASGSNRPTYKTNIVNSLPVMRMTSSQSLSTSASASLTAYTALAVVKPAGTSGYRPVLGSSGGNGGLMWRTYATTNVMNLVKTFVADIASSSTGLSTADFQIVAFTFDSSTYAFYLDGVADGSGSHSQTLTSGRTLNVGYSAPDGDFFNGDIAEIAVYDAILGSTDLNNATSFLATKYNIGGGGGSPANDYNDYILLDAPVAYYPLDEASGSALDISGNAYDMTENGTPTRSQTALITTTPSSGYSINCDATGDYFTRNQAAVARINAAWSVEAWVKPDAGSQPECGIVTSGYDGSKVPWVLGATGTSNYVFTGWYSSGWNKLGSTFSLTNGSIYHLVGTWDGTTIRLYIDGVLDNSMAPGGSVGTPSHNDYYIGRRWDSNNRFSGYIDEVAIYDFALSPTQVANHYTAGTGGAPPSGPGRVHLPQEYAVRQANQIAIHRAQR